MTRFTRFLVFAAIGLWSQSCGHSDNSRMQPVDSTSVTTVDELWKDPRAFVGKRVEIEGMCSRDDRYDGRRAVLEGTSDSITIRCDATPAMGGRFAKECAGKRVKITGLVQMQRIDEKYLLEQERGYRERMNAYHEDLAADAGNPIDTAELASRRAYTDSVFASRIRNYRTRIAARKAAGEDEYVPFYYVDAISYKIVGD